ncbi:MAG: alpha/beta fold hydrolase [Hyphomicrobiaceae bacterium]
MIDRNEHPIAWREAGSGDPVLFLHAMAGSRTAWEPQLRALSGQYRCIAWDMPGFGASALPPVGAGVDTIADMLAFFARKTLMLAKAHFVGLSVGAMILMRFATRHPALCRSLTLMDTSPKFGFGGDARPEAFAEPILRALSEGVAIDQFSAGMVKAIVGPACPATVVEEATVAMARAKREGLRLTTRLIADHDGVADLPQIACPVLAMAGADDAETPPAYAEAIAGMAARGEVCIVPAAGHLANLENSAAVNESLADFLARHS